MEDLKQKSDHPGPSSTGKKPKLVANAFPIPPAEPPSEADPEASRTSPRKTQLKIDTTTAVEMVKNLDELINSGALSANTESIADVVREEARQNAERGEMPSESSYSQYYIIKKLQARIADNTKLGTELAHLEYLLHVGDWSSGILQTYRKLERPVLVTWRKGRKSDLSEQGGSGSDLSAIEIPGQGDKALKQESEVIGPVIAKEMEAIRAWKDTDNPKPKKPHTPYVEQMTIIAESIKMDVKVSIEAILMYTERCERAHHKPPTDLVRKDAASPERIDWVEVRDRCVAAKKEFAKMEPRWSDDDLATAYTIIDEWLGVFVEDVSAFYDDEKTLKRTKYGKDPGLVGLLKS
ncbi:hypothetical protein F5Y04DRAFT_176807 [Hypomontagnella monticulosa]|nr:hypothetical protein F5Y04DRAFT_176807 [Hypomontagnella monticulosa]